MFGGAALPLASHSGREGARLWRAFMFGMLDCRGVEPLTEPKSPKAPGSLPGAVSVLDVLRSLFLFGFLTEKSIRMIDRIIINNGHWDLLFSFIFL